MATRSGLGVEDVTRPLDLSQVARGWHSNNRECSYWVPEADVEGSIPVELRGTLLRNGPGLLEVYGKKLVHRKCGSPAPGPGGVSSCRTCCII